MSDSEIVLIAPKNLDESKALSKDLAMSALMPQALRKRPEDVLAIVLTGAEMGLAPMQALRGIHIINGKASLSADLMGALVKRSSVCEYLTLAESTGAVATYRTKRKNEPGETVISFTAEQAKAAGLTGDNWKKYPDAMLRARCLAAICRAVYPDLCMGLYDSDSGEIEGDPVVTQAPTAQREHVASVKESLKASLAPAVAKTEITDAEFTPVAEPVPASVSDSEQPNMEQQIAAAPDAAALRALVPVLKALPTDEQKRLRPLFDARRAEVAK